MECSEGCASVEEDGVDGMRHCWTVVAAVPTGPRVLVTTLTVGTVRVPPFLLPPMVFVVVAMAGVTPVKAVAQGRPRGAEVAQGGH